MDYFVGLLLKHVETFIDSFQSVYVLVMYNESNGEWESQMDEVMSIYACVGVV